MTNVALPSGTMMFPSLINGFESIVWEWENMNTDLNSPFTKPIPGDC